MVSDAYEDYGKLHNIWHRTFRSDVPDHDLIWHMDHNMRHITVLEGVNWKLQLDNQLPQLLTVGETYQIPAAYYHRLIKGDSDLVIKISECESTHQE